MHRPLALTLAGLLTLAPFGAALANEACGRFAGTWRHAGGPAEEAGMLKAIDAVAEDMGFFARGIAKKRLRKSNKIAQRVEIRCEGEQITIAFDGTGHTGRLDGSTGTTKGSSGQKLDLRYVLKGDRLVQSFDGDGGGKRNELALDGDRLAMDVTIHSPRLPRDIRYRLTFARE